MKQIVVLSGKGGTGKTTVMAAFAHLASQRPATQAILVDADVDAANLELVLDPQRNAAYEFSAGKTAVIAASLCAGCGVCAEVCRFDAVTSKNGTYVIDALDCEGCAACKTQCPDKAIYMEARSDGHWFSAESRFGTLFHARLQPARENSGKLVTLLRQQAYSRATDDGIPLVIVDGPPGIGCPVIAAISGADLAVIVTEPTAGGIHDMYRTLALAQHFHVPALVCINKADLYQAGTDIIAGYCRDKELPLIGLMPFSTTVVQAMVHGQPITAFAPDSPVSRALENAWRLILTCLNLETEDT